MPPRLYWAAAALGVAILATIPAASCGGGGSPSGGGHPGTPAGTYTLDVKATYTSGTATLSHDIKLTLKVQ